MIHSSHDDLTSHLNLTDLPLALGVLLQWKYQWRTLSHGDLALEQNLVSEWSGTSAVKSISNSCRKRDECLKFAIKLHFKQPCVLPRWWQSFLWLYPLTLCLKRQNLYHDFFILLSSWLKNIKLSHKTKNFVRKKNLLKILFHIERKK